jgi:hypothetical protein
MISESRMTARDSFAHQRAQFLFARTPVVSDTTESRRPWNDKEASHATRRDIVRNGLIGFVAQGGK